MSDSTRFVLALERFADCEAESRPLQVMQWADTEKHRGELLSPDVAMRFGAETAGRYIYATARINGQLIGHCAFFLKRSHYTQTFYGAEDFIFVLPQFRRDGVGPALWRFAERACIARGVRHFRLYIPNEPARIRLWQQWGYEPNTINMSKTLTEEQAHEALAQG